MVVEAVSQLRAADQGKKGGGRSDRYDDEGRAARQDHVDLLLGSSSRWRTLA